MVRWIQGKGWCQARAHNDFLEKAQVWGADLICMLGADQVYEPDILERLLARYDEGYHVITALVPLREGFGENHTGERLAWRDVDDKPQKIDPDAGDVQTIDFIGSGVVLFPTELLEKMSKPWMYYDIERETYQRRPSGDTRMFWHMQTEGGAKTWVDTTIKVKHCHVMEVEEITHA